MNYQRILFFLSLLLCLQGYSAYDPDKMNIVLDGHHLADLSSNPPKAKEGVIEMIRELVKSGKYNVISYRANNWGSSSNNAHSIIHAEIEAALDNPDDILTVKEVQAIDSGAFDYDSYYYPQDNRDTLVDVFAGIVRREMDSSSHERFMYRGGSIDLHGMEDLVYSLGAIALADGFSVGDFSYQIDYSKEPAVCQVKMKDITHDVRDSVCISNMEMEYRWINQSSRECGYFVKNDEKPFRIVDALLCEPQHIQDFENYFQANLLSTCQSGKDCLSGVSGEELQVLSGDFLAIMIQSKVENLRTQAYSDTSFEYQEEFSALLDEITAFNLICERSGIDAMVLGKLDDEETLAYEARINDINDAFSTAISPLVSSGVLDQMRDEGSFYYKKCVLTKKEQGETNPDLNGFFKECEKDALKKTLGDLLRRLATEKGGDVEEIEKLVTDSISGFCPLEQEAKQSSWGGYRNDNREINQFDYSYDMNRCAAAMDRITSNYEAFAGLSSDPLVEFNRSLRAGIPDQRVESNLRQNTQECLENLRRRHRNDSEKIQECYEDALVETRAETILDSILLIR
jgi:hypothetical protein